MAEINSSLCVCEVHKTTDLRYRFGQEVRRMRLEHGYESVYELARACGNVTVTELMKLENGGFEHFSWLIPLARFYNKRIRVEFY